VLALGQNEVLCYLSYEVPYLGPEGVKFGRPTQAVGHTKQNAFKFKIAQQKQKSIDVFLLAGRCPCMKSVSYELRKSRREDKISFIYSRHVKITIQRKP
jgi:hypothetical protein